MNTEVQQAETELNELFFSIYYDADDTDLLEHRLPADRVADAIKQMYRLVSEADKTLNGKNNSIELFVSAPAEEGSLGIEFFAELINPQNAQLVLQALGIITPLVGLAKGALAKPEEEEDDDTEEDEPIYQNVFEVAQKIDGATLIEVHTKDDSDIATLSIDGRELQCEETVARLVENPKIRESVHDLITKPIEGYKNPSIAIGEEAKTQPVTSLDTENIRKIEKLLVTEIEPKQRNFSETVTFTQVNFDSNKGWKMRLNGKQVGVAIADEAFIERVSESKQHFSKSDEYEVELTRTTTYNKSGKTSDSYTITKAKKKAKLK